MLQDNFNGFSVTLKDLRSANACFEGYNKVVRVLQGREFTPEDAGLKHYLRFKHSESIDLLSILESNGLDDTLWAFRCVKDKDREIRLYTVWCARQVEHFMTDERSKNAILVAEKYANGGASDEELEEARDAAYAAASDAASDAASAASDAASDAYAASDAAYAAYAASDASDAASAASDAASRAASHVAPHVASRVASREAQKEMLIKMLKGEAPWQVKQY